MALSNQNSYVEVAEFQQWRTSRGFPVISDEVAEQKLLLAMDWLETRKWSGQKTDEAQPLAFPRDGQPIPAPIKTAQMWVAHYATITDIAQPVEHGAVKSKSEGDLSVTYESGVKSRGLFDFPFIADLLGPYLRKRRGAKLLRGANHGCINQRC